LFGNLLLDDEIDDLFDGPEHSLSGFSSRSWFNYLLYSYVCK